MLGEPNARPICDEIDLMRDGVLLDGSEDDDFGGNAGDDDVVNDVHCNDGEVNDTKCSKPQGDSALHLLGS